MLAWLDSFADELVKIGSSLDEERRRNQALLLGGLSAAAIPGLDLATTKIETGKWLRPGVSLKRWIPSALVKGLFWGTALPAAQHLLRREVSEMAHQKAEAAKVLKALAPAGVESALSHVPAKLTPALEVPHV